MAYSVLYCTPGEAVPRTRWYMYSIKRVNGLNHKSFFPRPPLFFA